MLHLMLSLIAKSSHSMLEQSERLEKFNVLSFDLVSNLLDIIVKLLQIISQYMVLTIFDIFSTNGFILGKIDLLRFRNHLFPHGYFDIIMTSNIILPVNNNFLKSF